ncbi:hypothetical protein [Rhizobium metallidurans]|uniref:Uncharacterized protein n=1 Tax=Rhizobium metallidurans TaxID=1265931 RepID=A0A7W6CQW3_9HYPH|nr:hypothetical protein [Rhizobium metallidurans]MBB3965537.1 hypothetical protein [Rhizobium metallidurans]
MQWFAAALLACGCVNLAAFANFPPARDYLATTSCSLSATPAACRNTRAAWVATYASAVGGAYDSQKAVAQCFSTGCDKAIVEDRVLGCAWRHVIVGSKHATTADADRASVETFCGGNALDEADRQTARDQAGVWMQLIGATQ